MRMRFVFGWKPGVQWTLLAAFLACAGTAHAECVGPPALTTPFHAQPSSENAIQLGSWFASKGQFECAVETFSGALKADPESAQLHYLDGLALAGGGHAGEAIPDLQEAVHLQPEVIKPHLLLASLFDQSGQFANADEQWKQAMAIDPHSELALESWGNSLFVRKDYTAVTGLLQHAPRVEPLSILLAKSYEALNNPEAAFAVLNQALKLKPTSVPLTDIEAELLVRQHKYDEAIRLLSNAVREHPENLKAEASLFRVLVLTQQIERARPMAPKLLAKFPHDAEILYLNGVVARAGGDDANAKRYLEEAVALNPSFFSYRYTLGVVLINLHEWQEAREQLDAAIAAGDQDAEAHHQLALALRGLGDAEAAARETATFQQMREVEDDDALAALKSSLGDADFAHGRVDGATADYREACRLAPDAAGYRFKLSVALHKAGDMQGERIELEQAVKLDPHLARAQEQLGYLLSRSGDSAGAVEHLRMAVSSDPNRADAWIGLAAELANEGQLPEAREAAATALRLDPGNQKARQLGDSLAHDSATRTSRP